MEPDPSLKEFQNKLKELKHFSSSFKDANDLWKQFNKELDRLQTNGFAEFKGVEKPSANRNIHKFLFL